MKAKDNEYTLGDLIKLIYNECDLTDKVNEMDVIKAYNSIAGNLISKLTKEIKLKNKTLYLKVSAAALKNELSYKKSDLILRINSELNRDAIDNIVFL